MHKNLLIFYTLILILGCSLKKVYLSTDPEGNTLPNSPSIPVIPDNSPSIPVIPDEPSSPQDFCQEPEYHTEKPRWIQRMLADTPPSPKSRKWMNWLTPRHGTTATLQLSENKQTKYRIVTPENPSVPIKRAAMEFRLWLNLITEANFPITSDAEPEYDFEIHIGQTKTVPDIVKNRQEKLQKTGYLVAIESDKLYLIGKEDIGTLFAVFAFLEEDLGVRWYAPPPEHNFGNAEWSALWDILNSNDDWPLGTYRISPEDSLKAEIHDRDIQPSIPLRRTPWRASMNPWGFRNRINMGYAHFLGQYEYATQAAHTVFDLVPPATYAATHPEYYALVKGQHPTDSTGNNGGQLEYTHPKTLEIAVTSAVNKLKTIAPTKRMITLSDMDNQNFSESAATKAEIDRYGAYSGVLLDFANKMAKSINEGLAAINKPTMEDITVLAYWKTNEPPKISEPLHPSISVRFALAHDGSFDWPLHSYFDVKLKDHGKRFDDWKLITPRMRIWAYPTQYRHKLAFNPTIRALADNIRYFAKKGVEDIYVQTPGSDWPRDELRMWIIAKLLNDPMIDSCDGAFYRRVEELFFDFFFGGYYGDVGEHILSFHQLVWANLAEYADFEKKRNWIYSIHDEPYYYKNEMIKKSLDILDSAISKSQDPSVIARIEKLKLGVLYVEAVRMFMESKDQSIPIDRESVSNIADSLNYYKDKLQIDSAKFYDGKSSPEDMQTLEGFITEIQKLAQ